MPSISLRGPTHQALKDHAATLGMTASPLAQAWIEEYAPFTDKFPALVTVEPVPTPPPAEPQVPPPAEVQSPPPAQVQQPEPVEAKVHPDVPLDPPLRDEPARTKPYVTHEADPSLKPPTPRAPDGGGIIEF